MNQNPEQIARDNIDAELLRCGWVIQNKTQLNLAAATGVTVREYQTDIGPADYVLFVNKKPVGIIEAKRAEEGERLTMHEEQTEGYATAKLKYLNNEPLFFGYESTGDITRFTDSQTNVHHTLKKNPLKLEDLQDFINCYNPENRHKRKETFSDTNPDGRWRKFTYDEIIARDKTSLDITWLKDKSLADLDNLPDPDELAEEIVENIEGALESFKAIIAGLNGKG